MGEIREWSFKNDYETDKTKYSSKYGDAQLKYKVRFKPGKIQSLAFKVCAYKIKGTNGKANSGLMKVDFLASKYHEQHNSKKYNFNKFINSVATEDEETTNKKEKFDLKNINFDTNEYGEVDPIKSNTTDSRFLFDNDDAIIFDIKRKNNNT